MINLLLLERSRSLLLVQDDIKAKSCLLLCPIHLQRLARYTRCHFFLDFSSAHQKRRRMSPISVLESSQQALSIYGSISLIGRFVPILLSLQQRQNRHPEDDFQRKKLKKKGNINKLIIIIIINNVNNGNIHSSSPLWIESHY